MRSEAEVWGWLDEVPDPEIPVVSVVDLGMVRRVAVDGDDVTVDVSPTYSGCPATEVIESSIERKLLEEGVATGAVNNIVVLGTVASGGARDE